MGSLRGAEPLFLKKNPPLLIISPGEGDKGGEVKEYQKREIGKG